MKRQLITDKEEFKKAILRDYKLDEILDLLYEAEMSLREYTDKEEVKDKPIKVTEEEYKKIMGLFSVKGFINYGTDECKEDRRGHRTPKATPRPEK